MKKIITGIILLGLSFSTFVFAYGTPEINSANNLAEKKIINNHFDDLDKYYLDDFVLRQEIGAIAMKLAKLKKEGKCENIFKDVSSTKPNDWVCKNIEALAKNNLISRNELFNPEKNISKTEALSMLIKAIGFKDYIIDENSEKNWQEQIVDFAVKNKIVKEFKDYNKEATRGWVFMVADYSINIKEFREKEKIIKKETKLISGEVKIDNKTIRFESISNPGTCIGASSQCNFCTREDSEEEFICTESFCEDETFKCNEYE